MIAKNEFQQDTILRILQRLDRFEERIEKLDGQMTVTNKWLEKLEARNDRLEEVRTDLTDRLQKSLETETNENKGNKEIILQLLENDRKEREKLTLMIDGEKNRKQERFLRIWAVIGPVIASVLTSLLGRFFH